MVAGGLQLGTKELKARSYKRKPRSVPKCRAEKYVLTHVSACRSMALEYFVRMTF